MLEYGIYSQPEPARNPADFRAISNAKYQLTDQ
jgi:hypothetical protein